MKYIGIIGNGFVGKASCQLKNKKLGILIYDSDPQRCEPLNMSLRELVERVELIFISVPTPMNIDGSCSTTIVESVIREIKLYKSDPCIIIRSTVPIGFCREWGVHFMPEFLTEKNFLKDFEMNPEWIIGVDNPNDDVIGKIQNVLTLAKKHKKIKSDVLIVKSTQEAEAIKYFRNCYLALKVSFCNEFYDFCSTTGINYDNVIEIAAADQRIGLSHTKVPGPDGRRGFGGTCFPKDVSSLIIQFNKKNIACPILKSYQERNLQIDRKEKDWMSDRGRAVV